MEFVSKRMVACQLGRKFFIPGHSSNHISIFVHVSRKMIWKIKLTDTTLIHSFVFQAALLPIAPPSQ